MAKDVKRYFLIVLSVAFASFMVRLNNYTVNVSLPAIAEHFNVGTGQASRIVMSYLLIITSTLLLFGKLGDRTGLKKIFLYGYAIFVIGSLLCGFSEGIYALIGSRVVQGIGGSMLLATSFAIISKFLPSGRTGWAFGITSTASALGVATGAPLGGIITGYLSWHWIFFINVPVGIIAILVAGRQIPKEPGPPYASSEKQDAGGTGIHKKERFDLLGALLSFFGFSVLLYGFNMGKEFGWASPAIILCFAVSAMLLFLLILREKKFSAPLLDLAIFKNAGFTLALCATFMAYLLISGNAFIMPFYLKMTKGLNSQQIGMVLLVYSLIYVFMSSYAGRLSDRMDPVRLCTIAMFFAAVNTFVFSYTLYFQGLLFSLVFLVWMALSLVFFFFFSPNNKQVMSYAPSNMHGVASGVFNTATNLSMVIGVAIFEAVFSHFSGGISTKGIALEPSGIQQMALLKGFSAAYVLGGLACIGAFIFSLLIRSRR